MNRPENVARRIETRRLLLEISTSGSSDSDGDRNDDSHHHHENSDDDDGATEKWGRKRKQPQRNSTHRCFLPSLARFIFVILMMYQIVQHNKSSNEYESIIEQREKSKPAQALTPNDGRGDGSYPLDSIAITEEDTTSFSEKEELPKQQQQADKEEVIKDTASNGNTSILDMGPNSPYAYAFLVGGCDKNEPSSQYFLHDVLVATRIMREDGSNADVLVMIQMGPNSQEESLQPHEEAWLRALEIRVQYIPKSGANSRYSIMMEKFRILAHDEYKRILFLDADVLPMGNLDYVFELSAEQGVLKESLVVPGLSTPANGGFFMVTPYPGALEDLDAILKDKEDRKNLAIMQSDNGKERIQGKHVDTKYFDPVMGWGHQITPPDKWIKVNGSGVEWDFIAAYADQGLLYHFTKYFRQSLSVVLGNQVQNWGSNKNNETVLEQTLESPFAKVPVPPYRGVVDNCWRWSANTDGNCYPPMADYQHFNGKQKPWIVGPPELQPTLEHARDSPQHLWFYYLDQLNHELDMGLNFAEWGKDEPDGEWTPPVGFHLRPNAQEGVTTNLLGN